MAKPGGRISVSFLLNARHEPHAPAVGSMPLLAKNSGLPLRLNGPNIDVTLDGLSDECRVTER